MGRMIQVTSTTEGPDPKMESAERSSVSEPPCAAGSRGNGSVPTDVDRAAAINMLPSPDGEHTCDACTKDITGVSKTLLTLNL